MGGLMMSTITAFLEQTPWWVYLLFFYLIKLGIGASKTSVVPLKKLVILPLIFTVLSIHTMIVSFQVTAAVVEVWFASILLGTFFGYVLVRNYVFRVDKKKYLIELPGNWITLILVLAIFVSKYYFGYAMSMDPTVVHNTHFEFIMLSVSGIITGLFIGRLICYLNEFRVGKSVELTEDKS